MTTVNPTTPLGSDNISGGDEDLRDSKRGLQETILVDHHLGVVPDTTETVTAGSSWDGTGTDVGKHKQVTLMEQAAPSAPDATQLILQGTDVSGKTELVLYNEELANNSCQLTSIKEVESTDYTLHKLDKQDFAIGGNDVVDDVTITADVADGLKLKAGDATNGFDGSHANDDFVGLTT